jgi:hypothetical protein
MSDQFDNSENLFTDNDDPAEALLQSAGQGDDVPDFEDLFDEPGLKTNDDATDGEETETGPAREGFRVPEKLEEAPKPYFADKKYYKEVLTGEGEISKRVHSLLNSFLNAQDSQDRGMYRSKLVPAVWELAASVAGHIHNNPPQPKIIFLRFAVLLPTLISKEEREAISRVVHENKTGEPIHYVDEWLDLVAKGRVNASAVDETKTSQKKSPDKTFALLEKARGKYEAQLNVVKNRAQEIESEEEQLKQGMQNLLNHERMSEYEDIIAPFSATQRSAMTDINNSMRRLSTLNKDYTRQISELETAKEHFDQLQEKEQEEGGSSSVDTKTVVNELNTIRQMAKLCVGRQGNHFPILIKQYLRGGLREFGSRERVITLLAQAEYLDPSVFLRSYKGQANRIVPYVILIPSYGDSGICWEPFERYNRSTSRGRLAVPMYAKDLRTAVIAALGDLRWQVAKEKAQHYWMEEGLTGWYYQWFNDRKMKGDVKDAFVGDYVLWHTKESEGTQKLDREVRDIFWRYVPFPQEVKDKLKNRGFVYNELYKKDKNRAMSDGY